MKVRFSTLSILLVLVFLSCDSARKEVKMEKLPYFDLKGFMDLEVAKLDGVSVSKVSRINGNEKSAEVTLSSQEWKEEFQAFYEADINKPSLALSYSTNAYYEYLIHELLPGEKGKVKEIKIKYNKDYPSSITFRMKDENMFFSTATSGEFYLNQLTQKLDHYTIETTQKVVFMEPTNIKISGVVR
ncbi:hypothetical protein Aoki45_20410 [Algoriphagus sp. oki45]|uniref:hypothetical protein n=1 Tax=Algoriphagus sp. oki45 TaxID=3067294 RepID=UPI0027F6CE10|nr:hypothetical protein Aoki45_20410 [Algoriphagus sp. oki45]